MRKLNLVNNIVAYVGGGGVKGGQIRPWALGGQVKDSI